jgi:hypothetical protein
VREALKRRLDRPFTVRSPKPHPTRQLIYAKLAFMWPVSRRPLGTENVSGLNGTAAWGARIYGDGRCTGDRPDRFGRVALADSTREQRASRMKGVGRFP